MSYLMQIEKVPLFYSSSSSAFSFFAPILNLPYQLLAFVEFVFFHTQIDKIERGMGRYFDTGAPSIFLQMPMYVYLRPTMSIHIACVRAMSLTIYVRPCLAKLPVSVSCPPTRVWRCSQTWVPTSCSRNGHLCRIRNLMQCTYKRKLSHSTTHNCKT